jgi:hypothetical protein
VTSAADGFCWEGARVSVGKEAFDTPPPLYPEAHATILATYSWPNCVRRGSVFLGLAEEGQHGSRA